MPFECARRRVRAVRVREETRACRSSARSGCVFFIMNPLSSRGDACRSSSRIATGCAAMGNAHAGASTRMDE